MFMTTTGVGVIGTITGTEVIGDGIAGMVPDGDGDGILGTALDGAGDLDGILGTDLDGAGMVGMAMVGAGMDTMAETLYITAEEEADLDITILLMEETIDFLKAELTTLQDLILIEQELRLEQRIMALDLR